MARRRRRGSFSALLVALLLIAALGAVAWFFLQQGTHVVPAPATAVTVVSAQQVDPANEGRQVAVSGSVKVVKPARDPQLGVSADAVVLLRKVEMLQWREKCVVNRCDYVLDWSEKPIDSQAFRDRDAHANTARFPFVSERFVADDVRLGVFRIDAAMLGTAPEPAAFAVHAAQLPPNLAATFRDHNGTMYAGADVDHPAAGDLRVSYRIVAAGTQRVNGIQQGDRLIPPPPH